MIKTRKKITRFLIKNFTSYFEKTYPDFIFYFRKWPQIWKNAHISTFSGSRPKRALGHRVHILLVRITRAFQSVGFNSGKKMVLRAFYFIRALTKALTYYYINRSQRHPLAAIENIWFGVPIGIPNFARKTVN